MKIVSHTGGVHGFVTSVTLIPELKLGIVVLTNSDMNWVYEGIKWQLVDAFMHLPYHNYSKNYLPRYKKQNYNDSLWLVSKRDSVNLKIELTIPLKSFAGIYTNTMYGTVSLKVDSDKLEMTMEHHKNQPAKLEYIGNNRFLCTYSNPIEGIKVFPFIIKDNKVVSFTLSVNEELEFTTYNFIKN